MLMVVIPSCDDTMYHDSQDDEPAESDQSDRWRLLIDVITDILTDIFLYFEDKVREDGPSEKVEGTKPIRIILAMLGCIVFGIIGMTVLMLIYANERFLRKDIGC